MGVRSRWDGEGGWGEWRRRMRMVREDLLGL